MVYQQPPQPPAQPYGYGGVPLQQTYGLQPAQPIGMPPAEVKWSGLSTGGAFKIPVIAFIGRLTEIVKDASSQYGLRIVEKYDQVQILNSPVPWPWATVDVSIKYSDREASGWGYHVESAKALGLATQAATLDQALGELVGKIFEMHQSQQSYGDDKATGQAMHGDVWRFMRIMQPGQVQPFPQPQYAAPQPGPVAQPQPVVATSVPAPTPVSVPAQPVAQPVVAPPSPTPVAPAGAFNLALDPADTAPVRAKKLLHARALNEWLGVALIDDKIKADPAFINTIYDQSFIVGLKASNQVTQGQDGKFAVIA